jgi:hypothetical protein
LYIGLSLLGNVKNQERTRNKVLSIWSIDIELLCTPFRSQQWKQVGRGEREKMGLIVRDVGEFW